MRPHHKKPLAACTCVVGIIDPSSRKVVRELVSSLQISKVEFSTDAEGVNYLLRTVNSPDVVIVQHDLPGGGVLEVNKFVRWSKHSPSKSLPVIAIGYGWTREKVIDCLMAGVNEVIALPTSLHTVQRTLLAGLYSDRAFISTPTYCGPDRRRKATRGYTGPFRRLSDAVAQQLAETTEKISREKTVLRPAAAKPKVAPPADAKPAAPPKPRASFMKAMPQSDSKPKNPLGLRDVDSLKSPFLDIAKEPPPPAPPVVEPVAAEAPPPAPPVAEPVVEAPASAPPPPVVEPVAAEAPPPAPPMAEPVVEAPASAPPPPRPAAPVAAEAPPPAPPMAEPVVEAPASAPPPPPRPAAPVAAEVPPPAPVGTGAKSVPTSPIGGPSPAAVPPSPGGGAMGAGKSSLDGQGAPIVNGAGNGYAAASQGGTGHDGPVKTVTTQHDLMKMFNRGRKK